jgi:hypothetical protein
MFVPDSRRSRGSSLQCTHRQAEGQSGHPRAGAPLARLDAPLAHQATTMPVETDLDLRESTRAANGPAVFSNAESRNGFLRLK